MLAYIYHALSSFRKVFSRHRTWVLFVMIVLGFLGTTEMLGISSFCRFWGLDRTFDMILRFCHYSIDFIGDKNGH